MERGDMFVRWRRETSLASFHAEMVLCSAAAVAGYRVKGCTGLVEFVTEIAGQFEWCH
jgi:hypothetical protein